MVITECKAENRRDEQGVWGPFFKHIKRGTVPLHTVVSTVHSSLLHSV